MANRFVEKLSGLAELTAEDKAALEKATARPRRYVRPIRTDHHRAHLTVFDDTGKFVSYCTASKGDYEDS